MKKMILLLMMQMFLQLIPSGNIHSQSLLPMKILCNHLVESSEINNCDDSSYHAIFIYKVFTSEKDNIGIYAFGANSDHFYTFLLLKKEDDYQILNAQDLNKDIGYLDNVLGSVRGKIEYSAVSRLFSIYTANSKYHKVPANVIVNGHIVDTPLYDARKIIETKPFRWKDR